MDKIKLNGKEFTKIISKETIDEAITALAEKINMDLKEKDVIFLAILNGAFMFASDLMKKITFDCEITFLKLASYEGTSSTGTVKSLIGLGQDITDKTVVILEDIVDTGITLENIIKQLKGYEPKEIRVTTFLFKPNAYQKSIPIDYIGIEIPNDFIVGYGLDYKGLGRNYMEIYKVINVS